MNINLSDYVTFTTNNEPELVAPVRKAFKRVIKTQEGEKLLKEAYALRGKLHIHVGSDVDWAYYPAAKSSRRAHTITANPCEFSRLAPINGSGMDSTLEIMLAHELKHAAQKNFSDAKFDMLSRLKKQVLDAKEGIRTASVSATRSIFGARLEEAVGNHDALVQLGGEMYDHYMQELPAYRHTLRVIGENNIKENALLTRIEGQAIKAQNRIARQLHQPQRAKNYLDSSIAPYGSREKFIQFVVDTGMRLHTEKASHAGIDLGNSVNLSSSASKADFQWSNHISYTTPIHSR